MESRTMREVILTRELIQDLRCIAGIDPDTELVNIAKEDIGDSGDLDVVIVTDVDVNDNKDEYFVPILMVTVNLLRLGYSVSYRKREQ